LEDISVVFASSSREKLVGRLRSFKEWCERRGAGNVQRLRVELKTPWKDHEVGAKAAEAEVQDLLGAALCALGSSLHDLSLKIDGMDWMLQQKHMQALTGLTRLAVAGYLPHDLIAVDGSLEHQTALRELDLYANVDREVLRSVLAHSLTSLALITNFDEAYIPKEARVRCCRHRLC
jgi:hypothetical protein